MIKALLVSICQLRSSFFWKMILLCLIITLIIFVIIFGTVAFILDSYLYGWLFDIVISGLGPFITVYTTWLFFPLVLPLVTLFFLDPVASYIERKYYIDTMEVNTTSFIKMIWPTLKFIMLVFIINVILFPLYFLPVIGQALYYFVNGYLYGREYFEMIVLRYHKYQDIKALRKTNKNILFVAGVLIVLSYMVPFFNLIAPIFATIFMVNIYHTVLIK